MRWNKESVHENNQVMVHPFDGGACNTLDNFGVDFTSVTPPTTTTRLGGVTTLQDNNKTKTIENIGIKLNDQSKRKQLPSFNLNQTSITKL
jgi:hypothetical protein